MANLYQKGERDMRPWGSWEVLDAVENFCVKRITVNPHSMLSLQLHHHRREHWIMVKGHAFVTLDNKVFEVKQNDVVDIAENAKHRIENRSEKVVTFIEVQTGEQLDENDIVRFEDIYGRI